METIPRADLERLTGAIDPRATLLRVWVLKGGVGNAMTAIEIGRESGTRERFVVRRPPDWALRRDPATLANEFALLRRLRANGIPCQTPRFVGAAADAPYLVVEYIDGAPDLASPPPATYIEQFARALAAIHRVDAHDFALNDADAAVEQWWLRPRERYDESLQERRILAVLTAAWPWRCANDPVLLHGDYWPGNVLWKDGVLAGVIDWEEACRGDPLFDLAIARLEFAWAFGAEAVPRFTDAYLSAAPADVAALPYWDLVAALRPAHSISHWAATWPGFGRPDVSAATMRAAHRAFAERAFAALAT